MQEYFRAIAAVALGGVTVALAGCAGEAPPPAPATVDRDAADAGSGPGGAGTSDTATEPGGEVEAALAKLPPELQQLAKQQKICPVSGEPLGSMGVPYRVQVKDREVLLCCQGCEEEIQTNPEKYLAKIDR
ncbi:MAG: hypothetical protein ACOY3P_26265 [Planctomycetota bacterium]